MYCFTSFAGRFQAFRLRHAAPLGSCSSQMRQEAESLDFYAATLLPHTFRPDCYVAVAHCSTEPQLDFKHMCNAPMCTGCFRRMRSCPKSHASCLHGTACQMCRLRLAVARPRQQESATEWHAPERRCLSLCKQIVASEVRSQYPSWIT